MSGLNSQRTGRMKTFAAIMVLLTGCIAAGSAQETSATVQAVGGIQREQFVPMEELDAVLSRDQRGVMLPREEFTELLRLAQQHHAETAPVAMNVLSCVVRVVPGDQQATVEMQMQVSQLAAGWHVLEIPIGNLSLEQAQLSGTPAIVNRSQDDFARLQLLHEGQGEFEVQLKLSLPLTRAGSDRLTAFRLPGFATMALEVECPAGEHLQIGGRKLRRPVSEQESAIYRIPAGGLQEAALRWGSEDRDVDSQRLLFLYTAARLEFGRSVVRWSSETQVSVFGSSINRLTAVVASGFEVTGVESTGLESWTLADAEAGSGQTVLTMTWRQPFSGERRLQIAGVALDPGMRGDGQLQGELRVPAVLFPETTSHTGRLVLRQETGLRLMTRPVQGVRAVSAGEAGESTVNRVFEFWDQDYELHAGLLPREREIYAEMTTLLQVSEAEGELRVGLTLEVLNEPLFELPLQLPERWQLQSITAETGVVEWKTGDVPEQVVLRLPEPLESGAVAELTLFLKSPLEDPVQERQLEIPAISLSGVVLAGGTYQIVAAEDLQVTPLELNGLTPISGTVNLQQFRQDFSAVSGRLSVSRNPLQTTTRSVIRIAADPQELVLDAELTVDVLSGTTRILDLQLSEDFGADVRFDVVRFGSVAGDQSGRVIRPVEISEQIAGELADGFREFQLRLDRRFSGSLTLRALSRQRREATGQLPAPVIRLAAAVRQHGLLVYEAYPEQLLTVVSENPETSGLQVADPGLVQSPAAGTDRRLALVWRFVRPTYSLVVSEQRFGVTGVPTAVCRELSSKCVLTGTNQLQQSVLAELETSGVQTLRFRLPADSFLWSTVMDGEPVEVRREGADYLVSLKTAAGSTAHSMELLFESATENQQAMSERRPLEMFIDAGGEQPAVVDVLRQVWHVHYPPETMIVESAGPYSVTGNLDPVGWFGTLVQPGWPKAADWTHRFLPVFLYCAAVYVVSVLMYRRAWKLLLTLCVVILLLVVPMYFVNGRYVATDLSLFSSAATEPPTDGYVNSDYADEFTGGDESQRNFFGRSIQANDFGINEQPMPESEETPAPRLQAANGSGLVPEVTDADMNGVAELSDGIRRGSTRGLGVMGGFGGVGGGGGGRPGMAGDAMGGMGGMGPAGMASGEADRRLSANQQSGGRSAGTAMDEGPGQLNTPAALPAVEVDSLSREESITRLERKSGSARLSVNVALEIPDDFRELEFVSTADSAGSPAVLKLRTVTRQQLLWTRCLIVSVGLLLIWFLRSGGLARNLALLLSIILLMAAASPMVSGYWSIIPDGVLIACVAGLVLLSVRSALSSCCRCCCPLELLQRYCRAGRGTGVLLLICAAGTAEAQESPPVVDFSAGTGVVVPYDSGRPALMADRVFVPLEEYLQLYRRANPGELPAGVDPGQPHSAVVSCWLQGGALTGPAEGRQLLRLKAQFAVWSAHVEPHAVTLPIGAVAIESVLVDGASGTLTVERPQPQPAALQNQQAEVQQQQAFQQANAMPIPAVTEEWSIWISGRGMHVVELEFDIAVSNAGGPGRCTIPIRRPIAGFLDWTLPEERLDLIVNGRTDGYRRDGTRIRMAIDGLSQLRLQWLPQATAAEVGTSWTSAANQVLSIDAAGMRLREQVDVEVRQGEISELELSLPEGYVIRTVESEDLAGWGIRQVGDLRLLQVRFRRAIDERVRLIVEQFAELPAAEVLEDLSLPLSEVRGSGRATGVFSVRIGNQYQIRTLKQQGLSQQNPEQTEDPTGEVLPGRRMLAWRYTRQPASASVRITPAPDVQNVEAWHGVRVEQQRHLWTSRFRVRLSGIPRTRLDLRLFHGFVPLEVTATGLQDWYLAETSVEAAEQGTMLNLQFEDARTGLLEVVIQGRTAGSEDNSTLNLAPPMLLGATQGVSQLAVWLDGTSESSGLLDGGDWRTQPGDAVSTVFQELTPERPSLLATSTALLPGPLQMALRAAMSSMTAESVSVTTVTETSLEQLLALKWMITRAPTDRFAVVVNTELAAAMSFEVPGQRRIRRQQLENGRTQIEFELQQPVGGQFFILGTASQPLPEDGQFRNAPPEILSLQAATASVTAQRHFEVVVNQSAALLKPIGESSEEPVAADQIATRIPTALLKQAVQIVQLTPDNEGWQLTFPEQQQVSPTVVSLATHETILAEDGSWRSRHQLLVTNESRQFLPVRFPEGSRLLYCRIGERPVRVVRDDTTGMQLIPIPQNGLNAAGFELVFAIAGELSSEVAQTARRQLGHQEIGLPVPVFPEYREDADIGISISRNRWTIWIPDRWRAELVEDPKFSNVVTATQESLEDAVVLSEVEQALQLAGRSGLSDSRRAKLEIQSYSNGFGEVLERLQNIRGNGAEAESRRNEAVQLMGRLDAEFRSQSKADVGGNAYLFEQDRQSNSLVTEQRDLFFLDNSGRELQEQRGLQSSSGGQNRTGEQQFRFEQQLQETAKAAAKQQDEKSVISGKETAPARRRLSLAENAAEGLVADKAEAQVEELAARGRQLLRKNSRGEEQKRLPPIAASPPPASGPAPTAAADAQVDFQQVPRFDQPAAPQEAVEFSNELGGELLQEGRERGAATGVLSLNFEIPRQGNRLDFIRVGGNPQLTLRVQSAEAEQLWPEVSWAAFCIAAAFQLLRASRQRHWTGFLLHAGIAFLLGAIGASLFVTADLQSLALIVGAVAIVMIAGSVVMRSFRPSAG